LTSFKWNSNPDRGHAIAFHRLRGTRILNLTDIGNSLSEINKWPGSEADHSVISCAELKNVWSYSSTLRYVVIILVNNQLEAFSNVFIYLFHFCTCFEQPSAHHQENQLYQYIIWYVSLCVGECLV